ncbi:class I SAM-dependent methyltransferase [Streptantibioticus rubrisoli]|uniref:Class I SAM-dependent methyltransferase n=1 Tax=Streptantibioticus rubrisoli TaxID=1387313 RepID=A0ABT1PL26_9ACTN|nr:class I SAM-dependent methyltransferase [Streptantibioticus rubrisoli]MCQ4044938.1 class I SAM-dependent methyltransferase [Streptantibioticus rubrisoli]
MTDDAQDQNLHARRASSFGEHASAYAEHRPDYPRAAVEWAVEPVADRLGLRVLDLGAGTGKLTEVLLRCGLEVTAVEPDAGMLAELRRRTPQVDARQGTAEAIPAPDASFDAVLVGQAFHWFDHDRALPEIARVLRPGGVLAALWNRDDDRVEWIAGLQKVARGEASSAKGYNQRKLPAHPAFGGWELAEFPHAHRRTADSLTATIGTHSHTLVVPPGERAALLGRVREYLASRPETASGEFDLPMVTLTVRCARSR